MKLKAGILLLGISLGTAWAQNPDVIQDTRSTLQNLQKKQVIDQNAVLAVAGQTQAKPAASQASTSSATASKAPQAPAVAVKPSSAKAVVVTPKAVVQAAAPKNPAAPAADHASKPPQAKPAVAVEDKQNPPDTKRPEKTYSSEGKRDPFISPVVSRSMAAGAGCTGGKRCLAIDQIALTGIVKSESGMIAVVMNAMNKVYFLRENDPVFNGYVVRITGDSIVFKETLLDKLGKPFEREVTKKIFTPAV